MRVIVTAGGTAGHTSPCEAVIEALRQRDPQLHVQWIGKRGAIEDRVATRLGVSFRSIPMEGWPRKQSLRRLAVGGKLLYSLVRVSMYLRRFRPHVVIGFGGYVSLPVIMAAQRMGYTTAIHEQNSRLGMANRMTAPRASNVFVSYESTLGVPDGVQTAVVGNPVREGFIAPPSKVEACKHMGLDPELPVLLVTGGSQGAQTLNRVLSDALQQFHEAGIQILWLAGKGGAAEARDKAESMGGAVQVFSFLDDMPSAFAAADLIVSRAGASSTAEIAAMRKPSILVPYPHATDNHQEANARAFEEAGAATLLLDADCTGDALTSLVTDLIGHPQTLGRMADAAGSLARIDAAGRIADRLIELGYAVTP